MWNGTNCNLEQAQENLRFVIHKHFWNLEFCVIIQKKNGTSYCLSEERIQEQAFKSISCTWNWIANARNERKSFTYPEGCLTQKSGLHTRQTNRKTETHCRNITVQCWLFMVSGCRQIMSWTKLFANCCPQMVTAIGIEKKKKKQLFFWITNQSKTDDKY